MASTYVTPAVTNALLSPTRSVIRSSEIISPSPPPSISRSWKRQTDCSHPALHNLKHHLVIHHSFINSTYMIVQLKQLFLSDKRGWKGVHNPHLMVQKPQPRNLSVNIPPSQQMVFCWEKKRSFSPTRHYYLSAADYLQLPKCFLTHRHIFRENT